MYKTLIETVIDINNDESYHLTRLLALIFVFSGRNYTGKIEGITKIAYFDFLLKYPFLLKRALEIIGVKNNIDGVLLHKDDKNIETEMMAFKFGPWDFGYRKLIYILEAKKLIKLDVKGKAVTVSITDKGLNFAKLIQQTEQFYILLNRCQLLKKNFGNYSLSRLSDLMYTIAPEILVMKPGGY